MRDWLLAIGIVAVGVGVWFAWQIANQPALKFKLHGVNYNHKDGDGLGSLVLNWDAPDVYFAKDGAKVRLSTRRSGDQFSISSDVVCSDEVNTWGSTYLSWAFEVRSGVFVVADSDAGRQTPRAHGQSLATLKVFDFDNLRKEPRHAAHDGRVDVGGVKLWLEPGTYSLAYLVMTFCGDSAIVATVHFEDEHGNMLPINLPSRTYETAQASGEHLKELIDEYLTQRSG